MPHSKLERAPRGADDERREPARCTMRSRDLASLRVLGLSRGAISSILIGGLAIEVALAIPLGFLAGRGRAELFFTRAIDQETFRFQVLIEIEPSAFTRPSAPGVDEQRVNVIIALTEPHERWATLGDGYRVEARIVLWQSDDVARVPQGSVFRHGDGWAVFAVDGGRVRLVPVGIGHRGEREVEIVSGLSPGASVAVDPGDRVKDGARVEAR